MRNLNYGQAKYFWWLIINALKDADLPDDEKVIHIVTPWIRDISLSSSGLRQSGWRDLMGGHPGRLSRLSDVLRMMKKELGFTVHVTLLDSADKLLASSSRQFVEEEQRIVRRLVGPDLSSPEVDVWKKLGLHAKMFVFPHGCMTGSTNLTNAGLFLNGENMTVIMKDEDPEGYSRVKRNAQARIGNATSYFEDTSKRYEIDLGLSEEPEEPDSTVDKPEFRVPHSGRDSDQYPISLDYALGEIPNTGSDFIDKNEEFALTRELKSFESEMRRFLKEYYKTTAGAMAAWRQATIEGELSFTPPAVDSDPSSESTQISIPATDYRGKLGKKWHRLFIAVEDGTTIHDKAAVVLNVKMQKMGPGDFPTGKLPDPRDMSVDVMLNYAFLFDDIWTCLYGVPGSPFSDHAGTDLTDRSLVAFTRAAILGKATTDQEVRHFWVKLVDSFDWIKFARNQLYHESPLSRERAIQCQNGLMMFHQRVLRPFDSFMSNRR